MWHICFYILKQIIYANYDLNQVYQEGYYYKKSGVTMSEIVPENQVQLDLLDTVDRDKHARLMSVMDGLTDRFGKGRVRVATQGIDNSWQLKSEFKLPCYTTRIDEIQKVCVR